MLKLVKLSRENYPLLVEMMEEWTECGEEIIPAAIRKTDYRNYEVYRSSLELSKEEADRSEGRLVEDSTFFCLDTDRNLFVGAVNIRHSLNQGLLWNGGHIGDGVRPSERGRGIGTQMVRLALLECKRLNIFPVLMVCRKTNIPSARAIEKNVGVLENEVEIDGIRWKLYLINTLP